jgi:cytochrome c
MKIVPISQALAAATLLAMFSVPAVAADAKAAEALARKENCLKCHSVDKKKDAPSFKDISASYKGKADAEAQLTAKLTKGMKVKAAGGEEDHKTVKANADTKNMIQWILSQ